MFMELADAIRSTQDALAELRRDDGKLKNASIGREQMDPTIWDDTVDKLRAVVEPVKAAISAGIEQSIAAEHSAQLFAKDAEAAATVTRQLAAGVDALRSKVEAGASGNAKAAEVADIFATDAENWANYSKAQADNAIAAKDEALQWAEYLAGPVVDAAHAPDFIAASEFPNGLFYQPVEGGVAGLWSAKWWALQAYSLVGTAGFYYLGAWDSPPLPGEQHPETGKVVPAPISVGSIYYDTVNGQLMVWNGSSWQTSASLTSAFQAQFVYTATVDQTVFSGADDNGLTPDVGIYPSVIYLNGVRLVPDDDYAIDAGTSTLTLADPVDAGSVVQWDLLVPSSALAPGTVNIFKIDPITPDGSAQDFTLTYPAPGTGTPTAPTIGSGAQLEVSVDGVIQETGVDYTASGATIHFASPPLADAKVWMVWHQPGAVA